MSEFLIAIAETKNELGCSCLNRLAQARGEEWFATFGEKPFTQCRVFQITSFVESWIGHKLAKTNDDDEHRRITGEKLRFLEEIKRISKSGKRNFQRRSQKEGIPAHANT